MAKVGVLISVILLVSCVPLKEPDNEPQNCLPIKTHLIASSGVTLSCTTPTAKDIDSTKFSLHVKIAMKAYVNYKLSSLAFNCVTFEEDAGVVKGKKTITLREIHNKTCGGDLRTAPRIINLEIDVKTLNVRTDKYTIDIGGEYQNLKQSEKK